MPSVPSQYVHTLGDSTLDNLYWMLDDAKVEKLYRSLPSEDRWESFVDQADPLVQEAKQRSVEGKLREKGHQVFSHAYDGFTTVSVLGSDQIGYVLGTSTKSGLYKNEKQPPGTTLDRWDRVSVSPLEELQKKVSQHPDATHYIALSVGGNDFRVNLGNPWRLIRDITQVQKRYLQIVDKIKKLPGNIKPLLIFQYRTDANDDPYYIYTLFKIIGTVAVVAQIASFALLTAPVWILAGKISALTGGILALVGATVLYVSRKAVPLSVTENFLLGKGISMSMFGGMLESFYRPIINHAKANRIPILDLPNTFNPHKRLYTCGIEPNEEGGALIAEGIDHIVRNHDFSEGSVLYSKADGKASYSGVANQGSSAWKVA